MCRYNTVFKIIIANYEFKSRRPLSTDRYPDRDEIVLTKIIVLHSHI